MTTDTERAGLVTRLRQVAETHQTVYEDDRYRKALFAEAADYIEQQPPVPSFDLSKIEAWLRVQRNDRPATGEDFANAFRHCFIANEDALPVDAAVERDAALDLLDYMLTAWEYGTACYEEPDSEGVYLGNAFRVDDDKHSAIVDLLKKHRPQDAALTAQQPVVFVPQVECCDLHNDCVTESPAAIREAFTLARMRDAGWTNLRLLRHGWAVRVDPAAQQQESGS